MTTQDIQFDSEFEIEGMWWLPENQDNKISGSLSYSFKDGITLKTLNHFKSEKIQNKLPNSNSWNTYIWIASFFISRNQVVSATLLKVF